MFNLKLNYFLTNLLKIYTMLFNLIKLNITQKKNYLFVCYIGFFQNILYKNSRLYLQLIKDNDYDDDDIIQVIINNGGL